MHNMYVEGMLSIRILSIYYACMYAFFLSDVNFEYYFEILLYVKVLFNTTHVLMYSCTHVL